MMGSKQTARSRAVMLALVMAVFASRLQAQPMMMGISGGYTYYPYSEFADPDTPFERSLKLQIDVWKAGAAFPLVFAGGKTTVINSVEFEVVNVDYENWGTAPGRIDQMRSISYTLFLVQQVAENWQIIAAVTPGLASDFEGNLSTDDIALTAILGAKHDFSERFSLGGGVAYQRDFGDPLPLPFVLVTWRASPRVIIDALLPISATVVYTPVEMLGVGLFAEVGGNRYHGDPDRFGVDNPQLKYSVAAAGPMVQWHLARWARLTVKSGYTFMRRFEFFDGGDKANSLNLKDAWFVQGGLALGM
jgi:hypothetical protein